MSARQESTSIFAPAKLNLRLRIFGRGADGYHALETLYLRLDLADRIDLLAGAPGLRIEVEGDPSVPADATNLCWRAADALHRELAVEPALTIRLHKRIPSAAGLGGGSSDAAAVLRALPSFLQRSVPGDRLVRLAGMLGSDVPFGLVSREMALGWERGRRLLPLEPPPPRPVLVAVPPFGISARDAYVWLAQDRAKSGSQPPSSSSKEGAALLPAPDKLADWSVLERLAVNDLERPVFRRHPELRVIRDRLMSGGARIAILCGSGACVAGIFADPAERDRAAVELTENAGVVALSMNTGDGRAG